MASLDGMYSPEDKPSAAFEALPTGEYKAVIVASEAKKTKAGDGEYIEFEHQIIAGEFSGRKVFARLNLKNRNPKAVEIARADLAQIRQATGQPNPQDSVQFHNIPMLIRVVYQPADPAKNREQPQNEIKGWKPISGATAQAATQAPAPYLPPQSQFPPPVAQAAAQQVAPAARAPWQQ